MICIFFNEGLEKGQQSEDESEELQCSAQMPPPSYRPKCSKTQVSQH